MTIQQRKSYFIELGRFLKQFTEGDLEDEVKTVGSREVIDKFEEQINMAVHHNGWFTRENVLFSLDNWSRALTQENLDSWLEPYDLDHAGGKTVAIIMAGNIPLVGFHDFISVLISGHKVIVKQSSNDQKLLPLISRFLISLDSEFENRITFAEGRLEHFDAVIATGSNNTARYFEYYFAGKPSIIRKNRNSVAVLTGKETRAQLELLGEDIFRYFGLGCRNVSKLYVPRDYDFDSFYKSVAPWVRLLDHAKYANNYDYNKAVYLMSKFKFLDNGFLILKEDPGFGSPIATVFYETYFSRKELEETLDDNRDNLQCIVTEDGSGNRVKFGETQQPSLWDYADNVDTLAFLKELYKISNST